MNPFSSDNSIAQKQITNYDDHLLYHGHMYSHLAAACQLPGIAQQPHTPPHSPQTVPGLKLLPSTPDLNGYHHPQAPATGQHYMNAAPWDGRIHHLTQPDINSPHARSFQHPNYADLPNRIQMPFPTSLNALQTSPQPYQAVHLPRQIFGGPGPHLGPPTPPELACAKCMEPLSDWEQPVQCEANCRQFYHHYCSGLTAEAIYLLQSEPYIEWLCYPCEWILRPKGIRWVKQCNPSRT